MLLLGRFGFFMSWWFVKLLHHFRLNILCRAGGQSHVCSWLPNEEGCIHDWYDSGTLESRTCQFSGMGRGSTLEPPCRFFLFPKLLQTKTKPFCFTSAPVRFSQSDWAASELVNPSSKDVERFPSHCFSPLIFQPFLSGLTEVFFARAMHSTSVIR